MAIQEVEAKLVRTRAREGPPMDIASRITHEECPDCGGPLRNNIFCSQCGEVLCSWFCYLRHLRVHLPISGRVGVAPAAGQQQQEWRNSRRAFGSLRELIRGTSRGVLQQELQVLEIDRLDQVGVEPGGLRSMLVFLFAIAGHGDQGGFGEPRIGPAESSHFVAIHDRQADIQQHDVGPAVASCFEGLLSVVGDVHFLAQRDQELGEARRISLVVVDDENSPARKLDRLVVTVLAVLWPGRGRGFGPGQAGW